MREERGLAQCHEGFKNTSQDDSHILEAICAALTRQQSTLPLGACGFSGPWGVDNRLTPQLTLGTHIYGA